MLLHLYLKRYSNASVYSKYSENLKNSFFKEHLPWLLLWIWMYRILSYNLPYYGDPGLSHIFEIPSIPNEKPIISIEIPSISIKILGISNKKFRNTRFYTSWIWNTYYFKKDMKSRVFSGFYVCPLASASVAPTHT